MKIRWAKAREDYEAGKRYVESVTDLTNCTHGTPPITNCVRCLNRQFVGFMEEVIRFAFKVSERDPILFATDGASMTVQAHTLLDRARQVNGECILAEDVLEASQDR